MNNRRSRGWADWKTLPRLQSRLCDAPLVHFDLDHGYRRIGQMLHQGVGAFVSQWLHEKPQALKVIRVPGDGARILR